MFCKYLTSHKLLYVQTQCTITRISSHWAKEWYPYPLKSAPMWKEMIVYSIHELYIMSVCHLLRFQISNYDRWLANLYNTIYKMLNSHWVFDRNFSVYRVEFFRHYGLINTLTYAMHCLIRKLRCYIGVFVNAKVCLK